MSDKGNLTCPVYYNLTPEDYQAVVSLSQQADCSLPQYLRYITRKHIHEKLKEAPEVVGG